MLRHSVSHHGLPSGGHPVTEGVTHLKRFIIIAVLGSVAAFATNAYAVTASTPTNGTYTSANYQRLSPWACGGNGGVYHLSDPRPILIRFGWFAQTADQVADFFRYSSGSYTITGPDGTFTDFWSSTNGTPPTTTQGITWEPIAPATSTPNGSTTVKGYASFYDAVLTFTNTGTYTITTSLTYTRSFYDGFGATKKGTYTTGPCTISVQS
jgi:hypothetical protein